MKWLARARKKDKATTISENKANADNICSQKQANKVTKGLRTFFKCFHEKKKINKFLLIMKGHAVTQQILFLRGIS